jgi:hypothetical protein
MIGFFIDVHLRLMIDQLPCILLQNSNCGPPRIIARRRRAFIHHAGSMLRFKVSAFLMAIGVRQARSRTRTFYELFIIETNQ